MRITVIGSGYVGLVTAACFADKGNHVFAVDRDCAKLAALRRGACPFFEPGLSDLLAANLQAQRLTFTADLARAVESSRVCFIAVGTPSSETGAPDLSAVESAARELAQHLQPETVVVMKSTVPVGTCDRLEQWIAEETAQHFDVVMNPEFLKEGSAVVDFLKPDRVVIGAENDAARQVITDLYAPFVRNNKPILQLSRRAAEMTKYAANAYLATRISFINEIAELCERLDIDVDEVRRGMGSDTRIGHHFLYPGFGYGGSCFPKDVLALANTADEAEVPADILRAVHRRNLRQRTTIMERILARFGPELRDRRFAVWGVAFKPQTDDIREAPSVAIITTLLAAGAQVVIHDPHALANAREAFGEKATYAESAYEALDEADGLLIATEWNEYRSPDFAEIRRRLRQPVIFDGRNLYPIDMMRRYQFEYYSVGRPAVRLPEEAGGQAAGEPRT